jgi:hypothetical protein
MTPVPCNFLLQTTALMYDTALLYRDATCHTAMPPGIPPTEESRGKQYKYWQYQATNQPSNSKNTIVLIANTQ